MVDTPLPPSTRESCCRRLRLKPLVLCVLVLAVVAVFVSTLVVSSSARGDEPGAETWASGLTAGLSDGARAHLVTAKTAVVAAGRKGFELTDSLVQWTSFAAVMCTVVLLFTCAAVAAALRRCCRFSRKVGYFRLLRGLCCFLVVPVVLIYFATVYVTEFALTPAAAWEAAVLNDRYDASAPATTTSFRAGSASLPSEPSAKAGSPVCTLPRYTPYWLFIPLRLIRWAASGLLFFDHHQRGLPPGWGGGVRPTIRIAGAGEADGEPGGKLYLSCGRGLTPYYRPHLAVNNMRSNVEQLLFTNRHRTTSAHSSHANSTSNAAAEGVVYPPVPPNSTILRLARGHLLGDRARDLHDSEVTPVLPPWLQEYFFSGGTQGQEPLAYTNGPVSLLGLDQRRSQNRTICLDSNSDGGTQSDRSRQQCEVGGVRGFDYVQAWCGAPGERVAMGAGGESVALNMPDHVDDGPGDDIDSHESSQNTDAAQTSSGAPNPLHSDAAAGEPPHNAGQCRWNIAMIILDATSTPRMQRLLRKTVASLRSLPKSIATAYEFGRYGAQGSHTHTNLPQMLTGHAPESFLEELKLPTVEDRAFFWQHASFARHVTMWSSNYGPFSWPELFGGRKHGRGFNVDIDTSSLFAHPDYYRPLKDGIPNMYGPYSIVPRYIAGRPVHELNLEFLDRFHRQTFDRDEGATSRNATERGTDGWRDRRRRRRRRIGVGYFIEGHEGLDVGIEDMDTPLSEMFNKWENDGVFDDTVVVIVADHGSAMGVKSLWKHGANVELASPVLTMVMPRGLLQNGGAATMRGNTGRAVSHYDLHKTLASLCEPSKFVCGQVVAGPIYDLLRSAVPPERDCVGAGGGTSVCKCWHRDAAGDKIAN